MGAVLRLLPRTLHGIPVMGRYLRDVTTRSQRLATTSATLWRWSSPLHILRWFLPESKFELGNGILALVFIFAATMDGLPTLRIPSSPVIIRAWLTDSNPVPNTVQQTCIPQAMLGGDIICQAKSGLGKTAVFVLTTLQQVEPVAGECSVLVMCHTRELAFQIRNEYNRFSKYLPEVKTGVFYGGTPIQKDAEILKNKETHPHIIVGTPGRLNALVRDKYLRLGSVRMFVLDECDKMLDQIGKQENRHHQTTC